jgi:tetratricopeptide (TPR) repeat protein
MTHTTSQPTHPAGRVFWIAMLSAISGTALLSESAQAAEIVHTRADVLGAPPIIAAAPPEGLTATNEPPEAVPKVIWNTSTENYPVTVLQEGSSHIASASGSKAEVLFRQAQQACRETRYGEAARLARASLSELKPRAALALRARVLLLLSFALYERDAFPAADAALLEANSLLRQERHPDSLRILLASILRAAILRADHRTAEFEDAQAEILKQLPAKPNSVTGAELDQLLGVARLLSGTRQGGLASRYYRAALDALKAQSAPLDRLAQVTYEWATSVYGGGPREIDLEAPVPAEVTEIERAADEALALQVRLRAEPLSSVSEEKRAEEIATLRYMHAFALGARHQWQGAIDTLREVIEWARASPERKSQLGMALHEQAKALAQLRPKEAIDALEQALPDIQAAYPAPNPLYAESLALQGDLYKGTHDLERALGLYQQARALYQVLRSSVQLRNVDYDLAHVLFQRGQFARAEVINREAREISVSGPVGFDVGPDIAYQQGLILLELKNGSAAQQAFEEASALFERLPGHDHEAARARAGLAAALYAQNRGSAARTLADAVYDDYARHQWTADVGIQHAAYVLGELALHTEGNLTVARVRLQQAWSLRSQWMGADENSLRQGLEVADLLSTDSSMEPERESIFEQLYPQLGASDAPLHLKVRLATQWARVLRAQHRLQEASAVQQWLTEQCATADAETRRVCRSKRGR